MHRSKVVEKPRNFRQNPKHYQNSYLEFSENFHFLKFRKGTTFGFTRTSYGTPLLFNYRISKHYSVIFFQRESPFGFRKKVYIQFCPYTVPAFRDQNTLIHMIGLTMFSEVFVDIGEKGDDKTCTNPSNQAPYGVLQSGIHTKAGCEEKCWNDDTDLNSPCVYITYYNDTSTCVTLNFYATPRFGSSRFWTGILDL